jgi:hypothetical protein
MLEAAQRDLGHLQQQRNQLQADLGATSSSIDERFREIEQFQERWQRSMSDTTDNNTKPLADEKSFTRAIAFVLKAATKSLVLLRLGCVWAISASTQKSTSQTWLRPFTRF